jgi:hypothetical protein
MSEGSPLGRVWALGKKRKEAPLTEQYAIVGHSGARDGILLQPGEAFTRSFTIQNTSEVTEKVKSRVMKLQHSSGTLLKESLLFLWPLPSKTVTASIVFLPSPLFSLEDQITLELKAPNEPGWCESYW